MRNDLRLFMAGVLCALVTLISGFALAGNTIKNADGTTTTIEPNDTVGAGWTKETTRNEKGNIVKEEYKYPSGKTYQIKYITNQANGNTRIDKIVFRLNGKPNWTETSTLDTKGGQVTETVFYAEDGINIVKGMKTVYDSQGNSIGYDYDPATKGWRESWKIVTGPKGETIHYKYNALTKQWQEEVFKPLIYKYDISEAPKKNETAIAGYDVKTLGSGGLNTISFTTPRGKINVNLTNDLAAGDSISGTVVDEPKGKNDKERSKNQNELADYILEAFGKRFPVSDASIACDIPRALTEASTTVTLWYEGKKVASTAIPISETQPPNPEDFTLPTGGQQGQPLEITGPCDGKITKTDYVKIGDAPVPVLAESPRKKVVMNNNATEGLSTIECNEHDVVTECAFRNIGLQLWADKLSLRSGETTKAGVNVIGLSGITEDLPLDLVASGAIEMAGGNAQHLTIHASEVKTNGTYPVELSLTGTAPGSFGITATVQWTNICTNGKEIAEKDIAAPPQQGWYEELSKKLQEEIDFWTKDAMTEREWAKDASDPTTREYWEKMAQASDCKAQEDRQIMDLPPLSLKGANSTLVSDTYMDSMKQRVGDFLLISGQTNVDFPRMPPRPDCKEEEAAVAEAEAAANESRKAWNQAWDELRKAKDQVTAGEQRAREAEVDYKLEKDNTAALKKADQWDKAKDDLFQLQKNLNKAKIEEERAFLRHRRNMSNLQKAKDALADCLNKKG